MSLRDEIKDYFQSDGLISPQKNPTPDSTGNGLLYLSLYYVLLSRRQELVARDCQDFEQVVRSCYAQTGLLNRSPTKKGDQEGPDDYIGVAAASNLLNSKIAWEILNYGNSTRSFPFKWIYNNVTPGKWTGSSWFGRMPQVIAHLQWCARVKPEYPRIWAQSAAITTANISDPSSCILTFLQIEIARLNSVFLELAVDSWYWRLYRKYPLGMKEPLALHLGSNHPIAKYWDKP